MTFTKGGFQGWGGAFISNRLSHTLKVNTPSLTFLSQLNSVTTKTYFLLKMKLCHDFCQGWLSGGRGGGIYLLSLSHTLKVDTTSYISCLSLILLAPKHSFFYIKMKLCSEVCQKGLSGGGGGKGGHLSLFLSRGAFRRGVGGKGGISHMLKVDTTSSTFLSLPQIKH